MRTISTIAACIAIAATVPVSAYWYGNGNARSDSYSSARYQNSRSCSQCGYNRNTYSPGFWGSLGMGFVSSGTMINNQAVLAGSDEDIAKKVREALSKNSRLATDGKHIEVSVVNGKVTLTGTVTSNAEKSIAESTARNTSGVTTVSNQLTLSK